MLAAQRQRAIPLALLAGATALLLVALFVRQPSVSVRSAAPEQHAYSAPETVNLQPAPAAPATDLSPTAPATATQAFAGPTNSVPGDTAVQLQPATPANSGTQAPARIATTAPPQSDNQQMPPSRMQSTDPSSGGVVPPKSR